MMILVERWGIVFDCMDVSTRDWNKEIVKDKLYSSFMLRAHFLAFAWYWGVLDPCQAHHYSRCARLSCRHTLLSNSLPLSLVFFSGESGGPLVGKLPLIPFLASGAITDAFLLDRCKCWIVVNVPGPHICNEFRRLG